MTQTWTPLCGGYLAYGSTGYEIILCTEQDKPPYFLQDPEGRVLASAHRLSGLKDFGAQEASARMEFSVDPGVQILSDSVRPPPHEDVIFPKDPGCQI